MHEYQLARDVISVGCVIMGIAHTCISGYHIYRGIANKQEWFLSAMLYSLTAIAFFVVAWATLVLLP